MYAIQKPYFNSENDPLGQLIITRDGYPVDDDTEALERALRVHAVKYMAYTTIMAVTRPVRLVAHNLFAELHQN